MKVALVITTYNQPEHFTRAVTTARETTQAELTFYLFLHSKREGVVEAFEAQRKEGDTKLFAHGFNRGLARSINDGILQGYEEGADVVISASSGAWYSPGDIDKIAKAAVENRHRAVIHCVGSSTGTPYNAEWTRSQAEAELNLKPRTSLNYGCFVLNPVALEKVGCLDENFWPLAFEDVDYLGRMALAGVGHYIVPDTDVRRISSANTGAWSPEEKRQYKTWPPADYFVRKWGRGPWEDGKPYYSHPFNNLEFSWVITPENRHAPYPGYNRPEVN